MTGFLLTLEWIIRYFLIPRSDRARAACAIRVQFARRGCATPAGQAEKRRKNPPKIDN